MSFSRNLFLVWYAAGKRLLQGHRSKTPPAPGRRHYRPRLESLEAREVPTMSVGMNLDRVIDYNPSWMFTDAFLESRPWQSFAFNTVTGAVTQEGTVHIDALGWPTQL